MEKILTNGSWPHITWSLTVKWCAPSLPLLAGCIGLNYSSFGTQSNRVSNLACSARPGYFFLDEHHDRGKFRFWNMGAHAGADLERANELAAKARAGTLSPTEEREMEDYRAVGTALELLKSKARLSLKRSSR